MPRIEFPCGIEAAWLVRAVSISLAAAVAIAIGRCAVAEEQGPELRCGGYCLYVALKSLGAEVGDYSQLEKALGQPEPRGYSMQALADCAGKFGMETLAVATTCENLSRRKERFACIALLNDSHYVLLADIAGNEAAVCDPPRKFTLSTAAFEQQWNGEALLVSADPMETEESLERRYRYREYARRAAVGAACTSVPLLGLILWRRRRSKALLCLIFASVVCISGCSASDPPTAPDVPPGAKVEVANPVRAIDGVPSDDTGKLVVPYQISNRGSKPLTIDELVQSCTCTRCELSRSIVPPGQSAELRVFVDDGGSSVEKVVRVTIVTNDPENPRTVVSATIRPVQRVQFDPPRIEFGIVVLGESAQSRVRVRFAAGLKPIVEPRLTTTGEALTAEWTGSDSKDEILMTLKPWSRSEDRGSVLLSALGKQFKLPVSWSVRERVAAAPASVMLAAGRAGERRQATVRLTTVAPNVLDVKAFELTGAADSSTTTFSRVSAHEWIGQLDVVLPDHDGVWRGTVSVACSSPDGHNIVIPVTAMVLPPDLH